MAAGGGDRDGEEFSELLLVLEGVDVCGTAGIAPHSGTFPEVVKRSEPRVDRRLNIFQFRYFVCERNNLVNLGLVFIVEVVQNDVGRRTDFNVLLLIGEIIEQIRVYFHGNLFV